jgi:excisionase family DNA binding protein
MAELYPVPQWPQKPTKDLPLPLAMRPKVAAKAIGVSERTLWSLTQRGEIPHARIGGCVIYPSAAVLAWLEDQTIHPPVRRPEQAEGGAA